MVHIHVNAPVIFMCEERHVCVTWFIENCTSKLVYIYCDWMKRWMDEWFSEMELTMDHTSRQLLAAIQFLCHQYHVLMTVGTRQPICNRLNVQQDCFIHFSDTDVIREPSL